MGKTRTTRRRTPRPAAGLAVYRVRDWERIYGTSLWPPGRDENTLIRQRQNQFSQTYVRVWVNDDPRGRVTRAEVDGQTAALIDLGGYELYGIAIAILRVAADSRTFRGYLVDWLDQPLDPAGIARRLNLNRLRTDLALRRLAGPEIRFLELVEMPAAPEGTPRPPAGDGEPDPGSRTADDAATATSVERASPVGRDGDAPEPPQDRDRLPTPDATTPPASGTAVGSALAAGQAPRGGAGPPGTGPPGPGRATVPMTVPTQGQGQGKGEGKGQGPKAKAQDLSLMGDLGKRERRILGDVGPSGKGKGEAPGKGAGPAAGPAAGPEAATRPPDGTVTGAAGHAPARPPVPSDAPPGGRPAAQQPPAGRHGQPPATGGDRDQDASEQPPDGTVTGAAGHAPPAPGRADSIDRDLWRQCVEHGSNWAMLLADASGQRFGRVVVGLLGYSSRELGVRGLNSEVAMFARQWLVVRGLGLPEATLLDVVQRALRDAARLCEQRAAGKYTGQKPTAISRVWVTGWRKRVSKTIEERVKGGKG